MGLAEGESEARGVMDAGAIQQSNYLIKVDEMI
jgi:hypothetical protein